MNQTLLTLLSLLAIYGLSSLALSRPDTDPQDDPYDIQTTDTGSVAPLPPPDDDGANAA